jgi:hypothetical protein
MTVHLFFVKIESQSVSEKKFVKYFSFFLMILKVVFLQKYKNCYYFQYFQKSLVYENNIFQYFLIFLKFKMDFDSFLQNIIIVSAYYYILKDHLFWRIL